MLTTHSVLLCNAKIQANETKIKKYLKMCKMRRIGDRLPLLDGIEGSGTRNSGGNYHIFAGA